MKILKSGEDFNPVTCIVMNGKTANQESVYKKRRPKKSALW